jgi:hypothetical protein
MSRERAHCSACGARTGGPRGVTADIRCRCPRMRGFTRSCRRHGGANNMASVGHEVGLVPRFAQVRTMLNLKSQAILSRCLLVAGKSPAPLCKAGSSLPLYGPLHGPLHGPLYGINQPPWIEESLFAPLAARHGQPSPIALQTRICACLTAQAVRLVGSAGLRRRSPARRDRGPAARDGGAGSLWVTSFRVTSFWGTRS